ncbi:hypothetical protein D1007_22939 [Hordeum vulgare]|nr:hypothetical protein D1007_22939 [Hordeum vulgare]
MSTRTGAKSASAFKCERVPEPHTGERVVFGTHFIIGFGLRASLFLRQFLDFFGLQMHYLGPNSMMYLACCATLCEGGAVVYARHNRLFSKMRWIDSFKKCQRSFFYVRSVKKGRDWVNLPSFADTPPTGTNWNLEVRNGEMTVNVGRLRELKASQGLLPADLVAALILCRVLPLHERPHRINNMGLRKDPYQLSTMDLLPNKVAARVNAITRFRQDVEAWWFNMEPFYHESRRPQSQNCSQLLNN